MKTYADTSVLVAFFHPADKFALQVSQWFQNTNPALSWNLILRTELRHTLRKLQGSYAVVAWRAYRASEKWLEIERGSLIEVLQATDTLSDQYAARLSAGTWNFFHVAAAVEVRAELFVTCDRPQAELASAAGLNAHLFT